MTFLRSALCAFFLASAALAQQCTVSFTLTTSGQTSSQLDNRTQGCVDWVVTYNSTGFSALSLAFQSAADTGSPSFVTFAGSVDAGVNPNTSTTAAYTQLTGYFPYVRLSLDSATGSGTIRGTFYGWRAQPGSSGSVPDPLSVKGCGAIGNVPACDPVLIAGVDNTGDVQIPLLNPAGAAAGSLDTGAAGAGQFETDFTCSSQAAIVVTASGLTQLVGLTSLKGIRVCHVSMSGDAAVNVKFSTGTGSNCGTGTADLSGLYYGVNSLALDFSNHAALRVPTSQALCVSLSGAANWGGVIVYGKF